MTARPLVVVTDGDSRARWAVRKATGRLGLSLLLDGRAASDPEALLEELGRSERVAVALIDDGGHPGVGPGEATLGALARHPKVHLLGVVAVASRTAERPLFVAASVDRRGRLVAGAVKKDGEPSGDFTLNGDGVGVLRGMGVPVVGLGDAGRGPEAVRAMEAAIAFLLRAGGT